MFSYIIYLIFAFISSVSYDLSVVKENAEDLVDVVTKIIAHRLESSPPQSPPRNIERKAIYHILRILSTLLKRHTTPATLRILQARFELHARDYKPEMHRGSECCPEGHEEAPDAGRYRNAPNDIITRFI